MMSTLDILILEEFCSHKMFISHIKMNQFWTTNQNGGRWKNPTPKHRLSPEARNGVNA